MTTKVRVLETGLSSVLRIEVQKEGEWEVLCSVSPLELEPFSPNLSHGEINDMFEVRDMKSLKDIICSYISLKLDKGKVLMTIDISDMETEA